MIEFQKEYLNIIQQQNNKYIISESVIDSAFSFFADLIPSTDSILGNSQEQAQTNVKNIIDKTIGKFSTFSQPITNINNKGKKLQKGITKPYQAAGEGKNVDEEIQKSAEKSADWSQAVIVKEFQKKARSQGLKFKGLSKEALNTPQLIKQKRQLILQYKNDLSKHIKKLIIQDANQGITPNMWFNPNAKQSDQQPIIFENSTITFKTDGNKLICEQIYTKTNEKHLICESLIKQGRLAVLAYLEKLGIDNSIADRAIPDKYKSSYNYKLLKQNGVTDQQIRIIKDVISKPSNGSKQEDKLINDLDAGKIDLTTGKLFGKDGAPLGTGMPSKTPATGGSETPATGGAETPATTDSGATGTSDAGAAGAAGAAGTSIKDKLKHMWQKIKQGIDKFVRFIGKIVLIVVSFIMTLMWFLIKLVVEGVKAVMKAFGKGGGGSFKGWNACKADVDRLLGVNKALSERIAGYLSLVLVGGAIMVMTISSSNSDKKQPTIERQLDNDLTLIADFQV